MSHFRIFDCDIVINLIEVLLINQEVGNKKRWKTKDIELPIGVKK